MSTSNNPSLPTRHLSPRYVLPAEGRPYEEIQRLNSQHRLFTRLFNNRPIFVDLHPKPGDNILDSATGAGSWAFDMASRIPPGVTLDAVDIDHRLLNLVVSPAKISPSSESQLKFHTESILDLPKAWNDRFVLVNQRFLIGALTADQWKTNISELHRVLAPNGWVQLLELNATTPADRLVDRPHGRAVDSIIQRLWTLFGLVENPPRFLYNLLLDLGFEEVRLEEVNVLLGSWAGGDGMEGADALIGAYLAMEGPMVRAGLMNSGDAQKRLSEDLRQEWEDVPGQYFTLEMVCGRKAA